MARQIIQQPNGTYALWFTVTDSFIVRDLTEQEMVDFIVEEAKEETKKKVNRVIQLLKKGEPPYHQFTMSWEEAMAIIENVHGKDSIEYKYAVTVGK